MTPARTSVVRDRNANVYFQILLAVENPVQVVPHDSGRLSSINLGPDTLLAIVLDDRTSLVVERTQPLA
jgi:hypothetical protein